MKSKFAGSVALLVTGILSPALWNATAAEAANSYVSFDGEKTTWHDGFDRCDETKVVEERYKRLGGEITIIANENDARSPLAFAAQTEAVDFILGKTK